MFITETNVNIIDLTKSYSNNGTSVFLFVRK